MFKTLDLHFMFMFAFVGLVLQIIVDTDDVEDVVYHAGLIAHKL